MHCDFYLSIWYNQYLPLWSHFWRVACLVWLLQGPVGCPLCLHYDHLSRYFEENEEENNMGAEKMREKDCELAQEVTVWVVKPVRIVSCFSVRNFAALCSIRKVFTDSCFCLINFRQLTIDHLDTSSTWVCVFLIKKCYPPQNSPVAPE